MRKADFAEAEKGAAHRIGVRAKYEEGVSL